MFKLKTIAALALAIPMQYGFAQDLVATHKLGLENDPQLRSVYFGQFSTAEIKSQSIAQMLPDISLYGAVSRDRINNQKETFVASGSQSYWNSSFNVNLRQSVFNWGYWVELGQSDNFIAQSEAQYQAAYQDLMVRITETYFNVLAAQDFLEFSVAERKAVGKQLEQAQQRFEVGLIAITDVYEAQAGFDQSRSDVIGAKNSLDDRKEDLREIIGNNPVELNLLQKELPLTPPDPADISAWATTAANNNFNIVAQLNQAEVARKSINLNRSEHLPVIDIVAAYGFSDQSTYDFGQRGDNQTYGFELNMPIFTGGAIYSRTKQAEFEYKTEKENLLQVERSVNRDVKVYYRGVISSISQVKALKATVKSSTSALEATEAGFQVGTRTMVDVLAEQKDLYGAKKDYSRSRYDYLINVIKLKNAAGSLNEADMENINTHLVH